MQTSLARRQRHRRALQRRPTGGGSALRRVAIAIPIVLLILVVMTTGTGLVFAVGTYNNYAAGLPDPKDALADLGFEQQTRIMDRTGKVELARLGEPQRRIMELAFFQDLTHAQISGVLDLPLGTVKTRMAAGMRKMIAALWDAGREEQQPWTPQ